LDLRAVSLWSSLPFDVEVRSMAWQAPEFTEVRMDAEINSYQDDLDREQDERF
jgi:coenzyme PQQ precursor peptide PqqA